MTVRQVGWPAVFWYVRSPLQGEQAASLVDVDCTSTIDPGGQEVTLPQSRSVDEVGCCSWYVVIGHVAVTLLQLLAPASPWYSVTPSQVRQRRSVVAVGGVCSAEPRVHVRVLRQTLSVVAVISSEINISPCEVSQVESQRHCRSEDTVGESISYVPLRHGVVG